MVDRGLDSDLVAEINSSHVRLTYFVKLELDSGTLYLHDGVGEITWDSQTWLGLGAFGSVGDIEEGIELSAYSVELILSGLDSSMMTEVMDNNYYLRPVTIYIGAKNQSTGAMVADPDEIWSGTIDKARVVLGNQNLIILTCESEFAEFDKVNGSTYSDSNLQAEYPGDTFFQYLPDMIDAIIVWAGIKKFIGSKGVGPREREPRNPGRPRQ